MSKKSLSLAVLVLSAVWTLAESPDPKALKVQQMLDEIQKEEYSQEAGTTRTVQEDELNAYLAALINQNQPEGLNSARVRLDGSRHFTTWIDVNFDDIDLEKSGAGWLSSLLTGTRTVQVEGKLETSEGKGSYTVSEAWLGSIPIPASLANSALKQVGEKQSPPFDPTESFDLPYGIRSIEVMKGHAVLRN
ncbi:MAG TPA: hypothetical protein VLV83_14130 [Acidobacteriota bacterium]|nr:hypothetical protein [Acidobacteriota bacterium]